MLPCRSSRRWHCVLADLQRDLARRVLPSDGPCVHGDRVFVWIDGKAKYKAVGRWARARVISQNGEIVTVETGKAVLRVNQSKVRRDCTMFHCQETSTKPRRMFLWKPMMVMNSLRKPVSRRMTLLTHPGGNSTHYADEHASVTCEISILADI